MMHRQYFEASKQQHPPEAGRVKMVREFDESIVIGKYLAVLKELI